MEGMDHLKLHENKTDIPGEKEKKNSQDYNSIRISFCRQAECHFRGLGGVANEPGGKYRSKLIRSEEVSEKRMG